MAKQEIKFPQKDAVAKLRQMNNKMRNQPASAELVESLKKRSERAPEKTGEEPQKKIAAPKRKQEPDLGL